MEQFPHELIGAPSPDKGPAETDIGRAFFVDPLENRTELLEFLE